MRFAIHHMRRQLAADPLAITALVLVVLLSSLLTTSVLRLLSDAETRQAQYDLASASVWAREPSAKIIPASQLLTWEGANLEEVDTSFDIAYEAMTEVREALPEPYRSMLVDERIVTEYKSDGTHQGSPIPIQSQILRTDSRFAEVADLVAGEWPDSSPFDWWSDSAPTTITMDGDTELPDPIEVVIHAEAAELLGWEIGDEFAGFILTGTYVPKDSEDPYWGHVSYAAAPHYRVDVDKGPMIDYSVYLSPKWGAFTPHGQFEAMLNTDASVALTWFTVDESALDGSNMALVAAQSRAFSTEQSVLHIGESEQKARFVSATPDVLEKSVERIDVVRAVLALIAVGPLAILLSVLGLGVRLIVDRRQKATAQLAARGASTGQIVIPAVVEGLLIGLTSAIVGIFVAFLATPGSWSVGAAIPALLLGLVPAGMLALSTRRAARGAEGRSDLGGRAGRWRIVAEILVLLIAVLSVGSLFVGNGAVGQLLAPIGVTAAAIVLALRLYPIPVALAEKAAAKGSAAPGFVGLARARRSPSGGLVPVIALVAGVSAALLSTVLWSTVNAGAQETVWQQVGAPVRVSGPVIDPAALEALDGIEHVAGIADLGTAGVGPERAQMIAVDVAALNEIQAGASGIDRVELGDPADGVIPILATEGSGLEVGESAEISGVPVTVTGMIERLGGFALQDAAVVVDRESWIEASGTSAWARIGLVDGSEDAVRAALPNSRVETPESTGADFVASPLGKAMRSSLIGGLAIAAALIVLTVFLMQVLDAPARTRVTAVLRTMGVYPGEVRAMTATSMLPTVLVSLVTGLVAGLGLPWLLTASADLRPLTGSVFQPTPVYDPVLLSAVLGGIVIVLALAIWWAARAAGKASLARELRSVEG